MTSLADIPIDLRTQPDKPAFIKWLTPLPLHYYHKRTLASLWSRDTKIKVTRTDCDILRASSLKPNKPNAPTFPPPTTGR